MGAKIRDIPWYSGEREQAVFQIHAVHTCMVDTCTDHVHSEHALSEHTRGGKHKTHTGTK